MVSLTRCRSGVDDHRLSRTTPMSARAAPLLALLVMASCGTTLSQQVPAPPLGGGIAEAYRPPSPAPAPAAPAAARASSPRARGTVSEGERPAWMRRLVLPDLPLRWYPRVTWYLEQYRSEPRAREIMRGWLRRLEAHRATIEAALARERLPRGLIAVAMIESGFSAGAGASPGAGGLWAVKPGEGPGGGAGVGFLG